MTTNDTPYAFHKIHILPIALSQNPTVTGLDHSAPFLSFFFFSSPQDFHSSSAHKAHTSQIHGSIRHLVGRAVRQTIMP